MAEKFFDSVKAVGNSIGEVVTDFANRFTKDTDIVDRLKQAAAESKKRLKDASADDIKAAAKDFADEAEAISRELWKSAKSAAESAQDTEGYQKIQSLIDDTVASLREKSADKIEAQDVSARLDELINRLRGDHHSGPDIIDGEVISEDK